MDRARMARTIPRRRRAAPRTAVRALLTALAALLLAAAPAAAQGEGDINVRRMVLGETHLNTGAQQLFQVTVSNTGKGAIAAGLRAELRDGRDRRVGSPMLRRVTLPARDEERFLFKFRAPAQAGDYAVRFEVLTADYKRPLIPGGPVFFSPFSVGEQPPAVRPAAARQARAVGATFEPPSGIRFERPDLLWENLTVSPPNLLLGETLTIRAELRNVGGDLAREIGVRVYYFNTRTPDRTQTISESAVQVLAPGERVELEFDTVLPDDALLGEYRVALQVDPADTVDELNETNNRATTDTIRLSRIKLIFPEPGFAFEEQGLFLFRWDSLRFDEFKVQVGTDRTFNTPGDFFDLPQGDKWTHEKEIVPLEGELPAMAQGLLERTTTRTLYWRVTGRDKDGRSDVSIAQPFTITPAPKPRETAAPTPQTQGAAGGTGGASGGATGGAPGAATREAAGATAAPTGGAEGSSGGSTAPAAPPQR